MERAHSIPKSLLLIVIMSFATVAVAQKSGGTVRVSIISTPSSG